jgi:hypothetical protein
MQGYANDLHQQGYKSERVHMMLIIVDLHLSWVVGQSLVIFS